MNLLNTPLDLVKTVEQSLSPPQRLTDEQLAAVEASCAAKPGELVKITAYAGTGKTSAFVALARQLYDRDITYLAFNKSVENEGKQRFGSNTVVKTVHAMAYGVIGRRYKDIRGDVQSWQVAKACRVPIYEATLITKTLNNFLNSADHCIEEKHVEPDHLNKLRDGYKSGIVDGAHSVWTAIQDQSHDFLMTHSGYLKMYQLSQPTLPGSMILLDEAQDTNPVTQDIVLSQLKKGKTVIMCGDPYQQIYAWRGAIDAMVQAQGAEFRLTQSFRFDQDIADKANIILKSFFNEQVPLKGRPVGDSKSTPPHSTAITRTNSHIFELLAGTNTPFHVIGREAFYQLLDQLLDVFYLYSGQRSKIMDRKISRHPTISDLQEYAVVTLDVELKSRCRLVDMYKDSLPSIITKLRANYSLTAYNVPVYCTCHKAKGLEWDSVVISNDFNELFYIDEKTGQTVLKTVGPDEDRQIAKDEVNLLYVAITRAKQSVALNMDLERLCRQTEVGQ